MNLRALYRWSGLMLYVTIALAILLGMQETETAGCSSSLSPSNANDDGADEDDDDNRITNATIYDRVHSGHRATSCLHSHISLALLMFAMTLCTTFALVCDWTNADAHYERDDRRTTNQPRQEYREVRLSDTSIDDESDIDSFAYDRLIEDDCDGDGNDDGDNGEEEQFV